MINKIINKQENLHEKYPSRCGQTYALGASIGNSLFFLALKLLKPRHPVSYCNYYCGILFISSAYLLSIKLNVPIYRSDNLPLQRKLFIRGIVGSCGFLCQTTSAYLIPIQLIGVLMATNCIWGLLFDAFVIGIHVTRTMIVLAFLATIGIILVVDPAFILTYFGVDYTESNDKISQVYIKDYLYYLGVIVGLMGAFFAVLVNWIIQDIAKLIHPIQSCFYALLSLTFVAGVFIIFDEKDGAWLFQDYIYLIIYYLAMCLLQLCIFFCNRQEKRQSYLSIFINFQIVWNFMFAILIFNDVIYVSNAIGASMVVVCGFFILSSKEKIIVKDNLIKNEAQIGSK